MQTKLSVRNKLIEIFSVVFELRESEVIMACHKGDLAKWDSLAHLTLITAIEEEFSIEFGLVHLDDLDSFNAINVITCKMLGL